jgi:hypothetical protein
LTVKAVDIALVRCVFGLELGIEVLDVELITACRGSLARDGTAAPLPPSKGRTACEDLDNMIGWTILSVVARLSDCPFNI